MLVCLFSSLVWQRESKEGHTLLFVLQQPKKQKAQSNRLLITAIRQVSHGFHLQVMLALYDNTPLKSYQTVRKKQTLSWALFSPF